MKLVTTATALNVHGPDHALKTDFYVADGALLVVAGGDPALGDPALAEARGQTPMHVIHDVAQAAKQRGIHGFPKGITVIDTVFDEQLVHPTWHPSNLLHWYGAPVAGVSFNDNCIDVTFVPTTPGQPATLELVPPAGGFTFHGEAITVNRDDDGAKHAPELAKLAGKAVYEIGGTVGRRGGPYSKPVDDPRQFLGEVLAAQLPELGIDVGGPVTVVTAYDQLREAMLLTTLETPLLDVLSRVNTNSQNMMAEALAKLNGLSYDTAQGMQDPRGGWASGHLAASEFLKRIGIATTSLIAADGSGLSRENRVTAELISDLLLHMLVEHEHGEHFVASMAISGVRGSVRNRMGDGNMKGQVFAKTGTIRGVSALSGYVFHDSCRVLVFSIVHNDIDGSQTPYRKQQDAAVAAIWDWLDDQPAPDTHILEVRPAQLIESLDAVQAALH